MDIGCETGKNALCLIQAGHKVTLLDITPNAIQITLENLRKIKMDHGVSDTIVGKIEDLDSSQGPFKAVVGTYTFSFIPPELFQKVMHKNVFGRVEPGGFFAGGFFGAEHVWANDPKLTIVTKKKIKELFASEGFSIIEIKEKRKKESTVLLGEQLFHTIEVIARRAL